jgi:hypothetical protein
MASQTIDASLYSEDTLEFINQLNQAGVQYLVVGGEAVIFHGYPRFTEDVDFFFSLAPENLERLMLALDRFWGGKIPVIQSVSDLATPKYVIQFGRKPNRIDLLNTIDGVSFEEAWDSRVGAEIVRPEQDSLPVFFLGREMLIQNKRASGRLKDQLDVEYLEKQ